MNFYSFQLAIFTLFALASAKPGFVEQNHHHVIQPVVAKVGAVVHTAPSAVSHQSITQVHNNAHIVTPVIKSYAPVVPVVKSYAVPVVHAAPVTHVVKTVSAPIVHTYAAPTVLKTVHAGPVVHHSYGAAPVVHHNYVAAPVVVKSAPVVPVVKTFATPVFNTAISHQSHTQIHQKHAVITPIVYAAKTYLH